MEKKKIFKLFLKKSEATKKKPLIKNLKKKIKPKLKLVKKEILLHQVLFHFQKPL